MLLSLAKIAAAVALGLPLLVYLLQDQLIFHPQRLSESRRADIARRFPAVQEISLAAAEGTRIHAWFVNSLSSQGAPLVVYFGGNAEEVSWMLEGVGDPRIGATPGVAWLLVDYRGYGASEGKPSEAALVADALAFYDFAKGLPGVDPQRIFAFGRSLGSGVAVQLAAVRTLAGLVLVAPYDSLVEVARHYYPFLPVSWMLKHRFDSSAHAPRLQVPLLCIVAERDEVVPPERAERLYDAWGGPKRKVVLPGARHNDMDAAPEFWRAIRSFLVGA